MAILQESVLCEWQKKYPGFNVVSKLRSGKEADTWLVHIPDKLCVLKVYVSSHMSTRSQYSEGRWVQEASLRKAIKQKTSIGKDLQQKLWTKREYYIMKKLFIAGASVPEVFDFTANSILMQYLGDSNNPAHRLTDVKISDLNKQKVLAIIESNVKIFLENGIVHADLSPYNILWWQDKPWIIDFPQSVDIRHNPNWQLFYERDLVNIRNYFAQQKRKIQ